MLATLGFLMNGFRPETNNWEVVIMARKLAVVAIMALVEPWGASVQTYSALSAVFAAWVLHALHFPFSNRELNALWLIALCGAFVTFEAGLFLNDSPPPTRPELGHDDCGRGGRVGVLLQLCRALFRLVRDSIAAVVV